ncbi:hypothetical protein AHAS_Ahas20G0123700 [Arachis hypogaea]
MDDFSGQLDNCLSFLEFALHKGLSELQQFHQDVLYLYQIIYSDDSDGETSSNMSLAKWGELSDYDKFKFMLKGVKEENVNERLRNRAIPFMHGKLHMVSLSGDISLLDSANQNIEKSFLVRWLTETALVNNLNICLVVIEEGCRNFQSTTIQIVNLERRLRLAEGHIEAGRLLAFYQVGSFSFLAMSQKPLNFFVEAESDEKGVKQIIRLILSKFIRRQPSRSDSEWATMWRDMQYLREKAFPFLDLEYILVEFCRGLLKAGKFSLAGNYLKGTSSIWNARECLNLYPNSANVKAEADIIDALTVKLPNLGVNILPMQFRQIKDPMEIVKMAITSPTGAYFLVDELIEVARLLGLRSADEIAAVEEAIAREAAASGDLQLAFDLCLGPQGAWLRMGFMCCNCKSVLKYDMQNLEVPTISFLGTLVNSGIRVLVYRTRNKNAGTNSRDETHTRDQEIKAGLF